MSYPLIFGEVLFDRFENGDAVLGGAPFNVAWHLHGLGCQPRMMSRIGVDALGQQVASAMQEWGMSLDLLQYDNDKPTGTVDVKLIQGQPSFTITPDVAYDNISLPATFTTLQQHPPVLLYHGSLAIRNAKSRETLRQLRAGLDCPVFMDINLRAPWWQRETLHDLLTNTQWLKLNHEELQLLMEQETELHAKAQRLLERYRMQAIIITRGEEGAFVVTENAHFTCPTARVAQLVDTVGAGDGFSAVVITGLLNKWDWQSIVERATEFAARICERRGATINDKSFYGTLLSRWL